MNGKLGQKLISVFLFLFAIFVMIITGISMAKPKHNLIPHRMAIYTLVWLGILSGMRVFWLQAEKKFFNARQRMQNWLFFLVIIVFSILLFVSGCVGRSDPHTDYGNVYGAAYHLSKGLPVNNWDYFSRCPNNRGVMLFLAGLLRFGNLLGMEDGYYFMLGWQVFHVILTLLCACYLAGLGGEHRMANRWTTLSLFLMLTPLYGNISVFYSDQSSFGFGIIAYTIYYIATHKYWPSKKSFLLCLLAGIIWGFGIQIKVTIGVSLIALSVIIAVRGSLKKQWKHFALLIVGAAGILLFLSAYMKTLPCEKNIEKDSDPILYWVALGLGGDGSYGDNEEFAILCRQAEDVSARREIAIQKIKSQWRNFFDWEHLVKKIRTNFAYGDLGASGYMIFPYIENNIIYQFLYYEGKFFWKYACLSTSYLFALLICVAGGALLAAFRGQAGEVQAVSCMALFGIMFFLMLWEAQNKQIYNHAGWLVLAAGYGVRVIKRDKQQEE